MTFRPELRGIWAPALTPVDGDLAPVPHLLASHVRHLLDEGRHGVVLFGTTGEATSFSVAERRALLYHSPKLSQVPVPPALLDRLRRGAAGAITATANVNAAAIRAVFDAHESGDFRVPALQAEATAFRAALQRHPMIPALKRILAERTGEPIWAEPPPAPRVPNRLVLQGLRLFASATG